MITPWEGSYGKVIVRKKARPHDDFNLYIRSKATMTQKKINVIVKRRQIAHTRTERSVLGSIRHPFIVRLHYAFQTGEKLPNLDYCSGRGVIFPFAEAWAFPAETSFILYCRISIGTWGIRTNTALFIGI